MTPVAAAVAFAAMYVSVAVVCGSIVKRAVSSVEERLGASCFLIGTAFAPFAIGLLYGAELILVPRLSGYGHTIAQSALCAGACAVALSGARRDTGSTARTLRTLAGRRGPYWRAVAVGVVSGTLLLVLVFALDSALAPVRHHDATVYALDARRVVEAGSMTALMTHAPDASNQLTNHSHGSSYQLYLAAALAFSRDVRQDFPLRVAQEILPLHLVVAVLGLALIIRPMAAVFAPVLLLYVNSYGYMISASSRDPYRLLPIVIVAAVVVLPGVLSRRAGLVLGSLAFAFVWNAHTSALLFAPALAGASLIVAPAWRARFMITAGCIVGFALGGVNQIAAYARTGDITAGSFDYRTLEGTPLYESILTARGAPPTGFKGMLPRLVNQFRIDGRMLITAAAVGLAVVAVAILRGTLVPMLVRFSAMFIVIVELLICGLFDRFDPFIATLLSINLRYRLALYPFVAVLIGWLGARAVSETPQRMRRVAPIILILVLAVGTWNTQRHWGFQEMPHFFDAAAADEFLAGGDNYFSFLRLFRTIPPQALILMDPAYQAWYHSPNRVIGLFDPRITAALRAQDSAAALSILDRIGVTYVVLPAEDLYVFRLAPLVQALSSRDFLPVSSLGFWRVYRRTGEDRAPTKSPQN